MDEEEDKESAVNTDEGGVYLWEVALLVSETIRNAITVSRLYRNAVSQ